MPTTTPIEYREVLVAPTDPASWSAGDPGDKYRHHVLVAFLSFFAGIPVLGYLIVLVIQR
jgi:hypothetical protein